MKSTGRLTSYCVGGDAVRTITNDDETRIDGQGECRWPRVTLKRWREATQSRERRHQRGDRGVLAQGVRRLLGPGRGRAVGVLKGSLYYYIKSKEDLLFRIVDDVHEQSRRILDEVVALDGPRRSSGWATTSSATSSGTWRTSRRCRSYFRDWRYLTGERLEIVAERRRGYDRVIRELIVAAQKAGEVDPGVDPKYASFFLLAAVNHVPDWYGATPETPPPTSRGPTRTSRSGTLVGTRSPASSPAPAVRRSKRASST